MQRRLDRDFVRRVKPDPEQTMFYTEGGGFALRVTPAGARSYTLDYRTPNGKTRRATLGKVGEIDLDEARNRAAAWRDKLRLGIDPAEEIAERRGAATVRELWERVEKEHLPSKAASTRRMYQGAFERHLLPALGRRRVDAVRWADLAALHSALKRRAPFEANRLLAVARKSWALAARWGLWPHEKANPAAGHDLAREPRRGRVYETDQLRAIGEALDASRSIAAAAIRLAFLTGARPAELYGARWADLDEGGRVLRLPESKTGPRAVYLGRPAADLLAALPRKDDAVYIFPGRRKGKPLTSLRATWERIAEAAKLPATARLYDARHTWATTAAEIGIPEDRRRRLTGHSARGGDAHGRYLHVRTSVLLRDADRVAGALFATMQGSDVGRVVDFPSLGR